MTSQDQLKTASKHALISFDLPELGSKQQGKVRDIYRQQRQGVNELVLITTDRLSAFDRILGTVPYKGQVLTQLSAFWFEAIKDIIGNYVIDIPHPNVTVGYACQALAVEVIVRGFISGETKTSLWYRYNLGERQVYGYDFPDGLTKNAALPEAIITPTTKGGPGSHDERLTVDEVVSQGHLEADLWQQVQTAALAIFAKGQAIARNAGLILVDSKYEFGLLPTGELVIIDELHTPDSSRFWRLDSYQERLASGLEPENMDKEFIRLWYAERGYRGEGTAPPWDEGLALDASLRYQQVYEKLTNQHFEAVSYPVVADITSALLARYGGKHE